MSAGNLNHRIFEKYPHSADYEPDLALLKDAPFKIIGMADIVAEDKPLSEQVKGIGKHTPSTPRAPINQESKQESKQGDGD